MGVGKLSRKPKYIILYCDFPGLHASYFEDNLNGKYVAKWILLPKSFRKLLGSIVYLSYAEVGGATMHTAL